MQVDLLQYRHGTEVTAIATKLLSLDRQDGGSAGYGD